jgi:hypothetical protein
MNEQMTEIEVPPTTIIGNALYLMAYFERVEGGWIAYKTFNSIYKAPPSWKIEAGSIITESDLNIYPYEDCATGISVAISVEWIQDFIATDLHNAIGETSAPVWKVFIPEFATIVIPNNTDGKIRVNTLQLLNIIDTVYYADEEYEEDEEDSDWEDDEDYESYPDDDIDDEDYEDGY